MTYCIDTSAMIDAGLRYYPVDLFTGFWDNMHNLAVDGRLKAPEMLIDELSKQDEEWKEWVYARRDLIIIPPTPEFINNTNAVVETYIQMGANPESLTGDPFFIAQAITSGLTLLTSEKLGKGPVKIPKVCNKIGVNTCNLLDLMRNEKWKF